MAGVEDRQAGPRVGDELRSTREELGFSLEDAERMTNIHARHLAALERDDFDALPSRAWARGFLLTYANRLGLDGEGLAERVLPLRRQSKPLGWATRHWRALTAVSGALAVAAMFTLAGLAVVPYNDFARGVADALSKIAPGLFLDSGTQRVALLGLTADGAIGGDNVLVAKVGGDGLGLLSIPGNTAAEIPDHGAGEVGDALALGGPDLTRRTVARLSGTEVPYYLVIDAEGVMDVVDTMGGVRVDVPRTVSGHARGDPITLRQGSQSLDGDEALVYLKGSDLPDNTRRAERQRDFLYAMFRQALAPGNLISNPTTLTTVLNSTETNLSIPKAFQLANRLRALEDSGVGVRTGVVPVQQSAPDANSEPDGERLQAVLEETVR